ncbi:MAG: hypothetical protein FCO83_00865 [Spiroplasma sp. WSS]|uniref:hypothetical protein n=2 Tax=Spiroplasma TaxID=2132 RepID=UPI00120AB2A5|nr:hypothetical protein [Spiroplasma endosymbiont of Lariophagus distinguendus]TLF27580.1 MAG: hypothetical protein FCO83_00865 [Spiroplasma sp. WSS]
MNFQIIYYIALVMFILLLVILGWGWYSFNKPKTTIKFLNLKLLVATLIVGVIGLVISIVPIGMQVWTFEPEYIKSDPAFLTLLIVEYIFLVIMLGLAYIFSFDFGIAVDEHNIYFFGQSVNTSKIVALEQKKNVLKIVYEQGIKKIKKRLTIITPQAQLFVKDHLAQKVIANVELETVAESANNDSLSSDNSK